MCPYESINRIANLNRRDILVPPELFMCCRVALFDYRFLVGGELAPRAMNLLAASRSKGTSCRPSGALFYCASEMEPRHPDAKNYSFRRVVGLLAVTRRLIKRQITPKGLRPAVTRQFIAVIMNYDTQCNFASGTELDATKRVACFPRSFRSRKACG